MKGIPTARTIVILLVILGILAYITYSFVSTNGRFSGLKNDLKAVEPVSEELAYTDLLGNEVLLSSMKGRPLIMNSWATWNPFSKDELMMLSALKTERGNTIEIIAINRKEDKEYMKAYLEQLGIPQNITFLVDPGDTFYKAIGGYAMPETVFYRGDGTLVHHTRGVLTQEEFNQAVTAILE